MSRRLLRRPLLAAIFLFPILLISYLIITWNRTETLFFEENYIKVGDGAFSSPGAPEKCNLPIDVSPFDESIKEYLVKYPNTIECSEGDSFQPLTYIDESTGILRQNTSFSGECEFRWIVRVPTDDDAIAYSPWEKLDPIDGLPLTKLENYLQVSCDERRYDNLHFWFNFKALPSRPPPSSSSSKPSVIILVIESLSRLNYLRYLNQTRERLERHLGNTFYLDGLNKMADNSYPNMVPLLTGRRLYKGELGPGLDEDFGPYDSWPFIWKNFTRSGYLTALVEDYPSFTLFNYNSRGFIRSQPTDLYPRPFWLRLYRDYPALLMKVLPFSLNPCFRNRIPKVQLFFDQMRQMIKGAAREAAPLFAFSFYIEMTHNDFNKAQLIDEYIAKFIDSSAKELNNSILIVMGDHGNRFGSVLQTTIGRIEERMPLFAMHLPGALTEQYPNLAVNLRANRRKLSTWLDANLMLQDIVSQTYTDVPKSSAKPKRAYSPWREEIPLDRSCQAALVDDLYCACDHRQTLNHQVDARAKAASHSLVHHLNLLLTAKPKCQPLALSAILRAEFIFPSSSTARASGYRQKIEITLQVAPSGAIFRSRLYRTAYQPEWTVEEGQVTRINEYGDQPWCISQRSLKPFCFCGASRPSGTTGNQTEAKDSSD